jgi:hypothetical protein
MPIILLLQNLVERKKRIRSLNISYNNKIIYTYVRNFSYEIKNLFKKYVTSTKIEHKICIKHSNVSVVNQEN